MIAGMTDNATPKKRKPSGAAVPGAFPRPVEFPATIVANVTEAMKRKVVTASRGGAGSQAEVVRTLLARGELAYGLDTDQIAEIERVAKLDNVEPSYVLSRFVDFAIAKIERERRSGRPSEITIDVP